MRIQSRRRGPGTRNNLMKQVKQMKPMKQQIDPTPPLASEAPVVIAATATDSARPAKLGLAGLDAHQRFLVGEVAVLAWSGSVQRANLYGAHVGLYDQDKARFREDVITFLDTSVIPFYVSPVSESEHVKHLRRLVKFANGCGSALFRFEYNWGIAQKLLNLYLKYLWSLGLIAEPPHCPVDSIVLSKTTLRTSVKWTQLADVQGYRQAIAALRTRTLKDGFHSLARWELQRGFARRMARGRTHAPLAIP
jgi:hypothetical protein